MSVDERATELIMGGPLRNTSRVVKNATSTAVRQIELEKGLDIQFTDILHLVTGKRREKAIAEDDPDYCIWTVGQSVGLLHSMPSCKDVIQQMVSEAESAAREINGMIQPRARL